MIPAATKVSIIIPLYNRIDLIGETVQSVQAQSNTHLEILIIDDGSTDGSFEAVQQMAAQDTRISLYKRDRLPKGAPTCRNLGATKADGDYLIFLDSDDLLAPFCIDQRVKAFQEYTTFDFLVFPMLLFKQAPEDTNLLWNIDTEEDDLARFLRWDSVWQTSCLIYRRSFFLNSGGFDESLFFWQDYELHVRLLYRGAKYKKMLYLAPDCFYRQHHQETLSQKTSTTTERLELMQKVVNNFAEEIHNTGKSSRIYARNISAMLFWFSLRWVVQFHSLNKSLDSWRDCFKHRLTSKRIYITGKICLYIKNIQSYNTFANIVLKPAYKLMIIQLPKIYRDNPSTMHKIHYKF